MPTKQKPTPVTANYSFFFSPEGRKVTTIEALTLRSAKRTFFKDHPMYKRAKGEIYVEVKA